MAKKGNINIFSKIDVHIINVQIYRHCEWFTKCQLKRKQVIYSIQKEDPSLWCNPMKGMKRKELRCPFSGCLFMFYYLMTSTLKVYYMLKIPHYLFPITFHFKQASCLTNYPAGNIELYLSENNHWETHIYKANFIHSLIHTLQIFI